MKPDDLETNTDRDRFDMKPWRDPFAPPRKRDLSGFSRATKRVAFTPFAVNPPYNTPFAYLVCDRHLPEATGGHRPAFESMKIEDVTTERRCQECVEYPSPQEVRYLGEEADQKTIGAGPRIQAP